MCYCCFLLENRTDCLYSIFMFMIKDKILPNNKLLSHDDKTTLFMSQKYFILNFKLRHAERGKQSAFTNLRLYSMLYHLFPVFISSRGGIKRSNREL